MSHYLATESKLPPKVSLETLTCIICHKQFPSTNDHKCQYRQETDKKNPKVAYEIIMISPHNQQPTFK
jgi:hypothetical protein